MKTNNKSQNISPFISKAAGRGREDREDSLLSTKLLINQPIGYSYPRYHCRINKQLTIFQWVVTEEGSVLAPPV